MTELSAQLARFVANARYEDLSPRTVQITKLCLLDAVGVSLAASGLGEGCAAFLELASGAEGRPQCTIFGAARKAPPEAAAFANGALAHALDYEDAHDVALLHPNAPTIPAALAIAEACGRASGRELLTALAVGCDVAVRLALSLRTSLADFGWYPPPILAGFGAAAAAAKLLGLEERQVRDAFSLVLCQNACSNEIVYSPRSLMRAVRDAFPARAAVSAALLARAGVTGFEAPFEGRAGFFAMFARGQYDPQPLLEGLGVRFEIENISFKPWPSCRGTHAAIEAALAFRCEEGIEAAEIERVRVRGGPLLRMLAEPHESKRRPATAIDAKFSVPFTTAVALVKGRVSLRDFSAAALVEDEVLALAARVDVEADPSAPASSGASVELQLRNGAVRGRRVDSPLGAPTHPMSTRELLDKFLDCAAVAAVPPDRGDALRFARAVLALEECEIAAEPFDLLQAPPARHQHAL